MKKNLQNLLFCNISFYIIMFTLYLNFCYINFIPGLKKYISIFSIFIFGIISIFYLIHKKYSKFCNLFLLYFCVLMISTIISETGSFTYFFNVYSPICAAILYLNFSLEYDPKKTVSYLSNVIDVLIIINVLTILFFPNGLYETNLYSSNWFLGYDNGHIMQYITAILLEKIKCYINGKKYSLRYLFVLLLTTYGIFYCFSANSVVSYCIMLFLFFISNKANLKIISIKNFTIIFLVIFIFLVILGVSNSFFNNFVVNILHKSLTFSGRTTVWPIVISYLFLKPILGYGFEKTNFITEKFNSIHATHAHNTLLDVAYKGGFSLLLVFIFLYNLVYKKLKKYESEIGIKFFSICIFTISIISIFESREDRLDLYIVLILSYNVEKFIKLFKEKKYE